MKLKSKLRIDGGSKIFNHREFTNLKIILCTSLFEICAWNCAKIMVSVSKYPSKLNHHISQAAEKEQTAHRMEIFCLGWIIMFPSKRFIFLSHTFIEHLTKPEEWQD